MKQAVTVFISAGLAALLLPASIGVLSNRSVLASGGSTTSTEAAVTQLPDPSQYAVPDSIPELAAPTPAAAPGDALPSGSAARSTGGSTATLQEAASMVLPALPAAKPAPSAAAASAAVVAMPDPALPQLEAEATPQPAKTRTKVEITEAGEEVESLDMDKPGQPEPQETNDESGRVAPRRPPRDEQSGRIAGLSEGANFSVSGRVTRVAAAGDGDMRVNLRTDSGEEIVALVPPWPGMRFPSPGGYLTARAKKLRNSSAGAVVRVVEITSSNPARPAPSRRVVPAPRGPMY
jgi:hypothetical protein